MKKTTKLLFTMCDSGGSKDLCTMQRHTVHTHTLSLSLDHLRSFSHHSCTERSVSFMLFLPF